MGGNHRARSRPCLESCYGFPSVFQNDLEVLGFIFKSYSHSIFYSLRIYPLFEYLRSFKLLLLCKIDVARNFKEPQLSAKGQLPQCKAWSWVQALIIRHVLWHPSLEIAALMVPEAVVSLSEVVTPAAQKVRSKGESLRADEEGAWWGVLRRSVETMWHPEVTGVLERVSLLSFVSARSWSISL